VPERQCLALPRVLVDEEPLEALKRVGVPELGELVPELDLADQRPELLDPEGPLLGLRPRSLPEGGEPGTATLAFAARARSATATGNSG